MFGLLRGGNATLAEWFNLPIRYREQPAFREEFMALVGTAHRPDCARWHDWCVSERDSALASARDSVKFKKGHYALRSISTGVYGYPIEQATEVALATVREALAAESSVTEVTFACFNDADLAVYEAVLGA